VNIRWLYRGFIGLLFPIRGCPLCFRGIETALCERCRLFLQRAAREPYCRICGRFFNAPGTGFCLECGSRKWPFILVRAAAPYEGVLRSAVHRLKFGGKQVAADFLGGLMADVLQREEAYRGVTIVVPVPLSPGRLRERGFNQAELLAGVVAEACGLRLNPALVRLSDRPPQAQLHRLARRENIKGTFSLTDDSVLGKAVILVDDVFTTGSTMSAAAETLLEGGASQVLGLVLASGRTLPK
jgi:ComF family protein